MKQTTNNHSSYTVHDYVGYLLRRVGKRSKRLLVTGFVFGVSGLGVSVAHYHAGVDDLQWLVSLLMVFTALFFGAWAGLYLGRDYIQLIDDALSTMGEDGKVDTEKEEKEQK